MITIFGASGFIGTHLEKKIKLNYTIQNVSLREKKWQENIHSDANVFINCIGKAHDHKGVATEKDFYYANLEIVKSLFQAFLESDAKLFIHISSIAVVEETEREGILNETSDQRPVSWYGKSKKAGEDFLLDQKISDDKKLIILRPTMIHGEGDKGNLGLLYKLISKGIPYPFGAFDNKRSFVSVDNVVFFIQKIIDNYEEIPSGVYNVADDETVSTKQLISIIDAVENRKSVLLKIPKMLINVLGKIGDVSKLPINSLIIKKLTSNLVVSNQKIKTALKIEKLPLSAEEGLAKTIKSFKTL